MATCPTCGNQTGEGAVFCDQCGTRLPKPEAAAQPAVPALAGGSVICPACGAGNVPGEAFCDFCGSPLEAPAPAAAPPAAAAEPAPPPVVEEPPPGPPAQPEPTCPACGAKVVAGEAFCADCGASLAQPPLPPEAVPPPEPQPPAAPEPAAPEAAPVAEPSVPPPAVPPTCPACGAEVAAGDKFCSNCGAALAGVAVPSQPVLAPPATGGPRLVVVASGAEIPLPAKDELLIGREDPVSGIYPEVDLTPHGGDEGGVSRRHARLYVEGGTYSIEDLNSTNLTFVNKQRLVPKTRQPLNDGDEIRCGRVALVLKIA